MKIFHSAILALTIGVACVSNAQARDSFSFGLNIGGGYPPPVFYAPPVTFYSPPVVYYSAAPGYYGNGYYNSAPVVSYQYYDEGRRGHRDGWRHEEHEHHGWGHEDRDDGGRHQGGWNRGHHDHDD